MTRLVIVFENMIEERLVRDLKGLGVSSYTAWDVRGEGYGRQREAWEVNTVRLETVISEELSDKVTAFLEREYAPNYALTVYSYEVEIRVQ